MQCNHILQQVRVVGAQFLQSMIMNNIKGVFTPVVCFIWSTPKKKKIYCCILVQVWFQFMQTFANEPRGLNNKMIQTARFVTVVDSTMLVNDILYHQDESGEIKPW